MALGFIEWGLILLGLLTALYYYLTSTYDYWQSRGVKGPKPVLLFGTLKSMIRGEMSLGEYVTSIYNEYKKEPFTGIFARRTPILILHDLDLIKDVLIKDFSNFPDRGVKIHENVEPLAPHLFNLEAKRWRPTRMKLSPVFTSGKLKEMFYLLVECAEHFHHYLSELIDKNENKEFEGEFRDLTAKFTTDVIGVCAFGLHMNAIADEESPFRLMGKRIFSMTPKRILQFRLRAFAPDLFKYIGHFFNDAEMNNFFIDTMKQTMDHRIKNNIVKHDFIDLLLAIKNHPEKIPEVELTDSFLAAQLFVFFIAGFETSSGTMSHALYELALHPNYQDRLREEIKTQLEKSGGKIDYETVKSIKYLDMVFEETLRKYPPVMLLMRKAMENYTFEDSAKNKLLTIEKDQVIWIPNYAIQMNSEYFPNPEVFDPERFTDEAIQARHPMANLPFGDGPRNCVGKRFGVMQTKVGLITILRSFRVEPTEKTPVPYVINPKSFLLAPLNGMSLKISKLDKNLQF